MFGYVKIGFDSLGQVLTCLDRFGFGLKRLGRSGQVWVGLDRFVQVCLNVLGYAWISQDKFGGLDMFGFSLDRFGMFWIGLDRVGQVMKGLDRVLIGFEQVWQGFCNI